MIIKRIIGKLMKTKGKIRWNLRELFINNKNIARLTNKNFSLIAGDCIGCLVLHDIHMKFNSPTVNLWMYPKDFLKYISDIRHYSEMDLQFISEENIKYPVAQLDDIKIYFTHYKTEADAEKKWKERTARINYDNIFIIMTDANNCTVEMMKEFDKVKYPHVIFTHKEYPQIKSVYHCNSDKSGIFHSYINSTSIKKFYDDFDFVNWFNSR